MRSRTLALGLALLLLLAPPASATWSIILVDTATGEVAVGSATCLTSFDLQRLLPVVVVEKGGAAAQSAIDSGAVNRMKIWDELHLCTPPDQIIEIAKQGDVFKCSRQYGIADLSPAAAGFTGNCAGGYKEDRTGTAGTISYAIQGNVLSGASVITAAEAAIVSTPGTLADKLMAGMQAARVQGGDGRCSCNPNAPTSCGDPPLGFDPNVDKSAHIGFMIVARPGDPEGVCTAGQGCANGDYWMNFNIAEQLVSDPDPVAQLQDAYDQFLLDMVGRPDGYASLKMFDDAEVLGDGQSTRELLVALFDLNGAAVTTGGASVTLAHAKGSAGLSSLDGVIDHGDGTYTVVVRAGAGLGTDVLDVRVDDGVAAASLWPYPTLTHRAGLLADGDALSASTGGEISLDLMGPTNEAGKTWLLAMSASGTRPGLALPSGVVIPLNPDAVFDLFEELALLGVLAGSPGVLDGQSRATGAIHAPPGAFTPGIGLSLSVAWFTVQPVGSASNAVPIDVLP